MHCRILRFISATLEKNLWLRLKEFQPSCDLDSEIIMVKIKGCLAANSLRILETLSKMLQQPSKQQTNSQNCNSKTFVLLKESEKVYPSGSLWPTCRLLEVEVPQLQAMHFGIHCCELSLVCLGREIFKT